KTVVLADHENVRRQAELTGAECALATPLRVTVTEELRGAARVKGIVLWVIHLAVGAHGLNCRPQDAGADADPVLAQEDDLRRIGYCGQRAAHHHRVPHVADRAVLSRKVDPAGARP